MHTKIIKKALLITAMPFLFAVSCKKKGTSCPANYTTYNFDAIANISPHKIVYNLGDTIYYVSTISKSLLDKISNQQIDYSNAVSIIGDNGISFIDTIAKKLVPARDSFKLVALMGSFIEEPSNLRGGINIVYLDQGNNYQFTGLFICKSKGIFSFGTGDLLCQGLKGKDCTKATFFTNLSNNDNHIQLYENSLNVTVLPEGIKRIYCFKVQ